MFFLFKFGELNIFGISVKKFWFLKTKKLKRFDKYNISCYTLISFFFMYNFKKLRIYGKIDIFF